MPLPARLGLFYAALYFALGVSSPYMPVWFAHRGLSGAQIGLILSLPMMARTVTGPLLAVWADSFQLRRTALILLSAAVAAAYALMILPLGLSGWMVVWFAASSMFTTIIPLTDVIVIRRAQRDGFNYGLPRGVGSAAYVVANVGVGALLARGSPEMVLVWMFGAVSLLALGARIFLPADPVREEGAHHRLKERLAGVGGLLRDPAFMTAAVSAGLIQSAHAFYYGFSTLTWKAQGLPENLTGWLWGCGVIAEVLFMWFLEPWRRKIGPRNLLVLGGAASVLRWTVLAFSPPLWLTWAMQMLHTLTYAATYLAVLQLVDRLSTSRNASAAQTINSTLSSGVLGGVATLASGWLFEQHGALGYLLMAAMSAAGLIGAFRLYGMRRLDDQRPCPDVDARLR